MVALLWRIALRNVLAHRVKSLIVGLIFALGAFVSVVGNALVDAMDRGMASSIIESLAGQLQIHARGGRDPFSIYGDEFAGMPDFGVITDFDKVATVIEAVPGVKGVLPMGSQIAMADGGNPLDRTLAALRAAVKAGDAPRIADLKAHVRSMLTIIIADLDAAQDLSTDQDLLKRLAEARQVREPAFWDTFDATPLDHLEVLENKVAPLLAQPGMLGIWFLGTDLDRFTQDFPRFKIVLGEPVPPHTRGFLFNHWVYEELIKHRAAWAFDKLTKAHARGVLIAHDPDLQVHVDLLAGQVRALTLQLGPLDAAAVTTALRTDLSAPDASLDDLLTRLLTVNDDTLLQHAEIFYRVIVPRIELYRLQVGDTLTLRTFTRTGYIRAVNLKIYGTFAFEGLEGSTITSQHNLMDLLSFRELFGSVTAESQAEVAALRSAAGITDVARQGAEDALFGGDAPLVAEGTGPALGEVAPMVIQRTAETTFTDHNIRHGMALHAAVLLNSSTPEAIAEGKAAVQKALDAAGLDINVLTWQEASGIVGQIVLMVRLVLLVVVSLLSIVALVIINNSVVMATMDRIREIGTLRAIGAQRTFIKQLFMTESLVLALVAGTVGALAGAAVVLWIHKVGLPATNEFTTFLYSGPALHPELTATHLIGGVLSVCVVGILATLYPAAVAARVTPVEAMSSRG